MKKLLFIISIVLCSFSVNAQNGAIFTLHPSLGTKVTPDEKKQYSIFPEIPDSTFESAQFVKYNDSTFTVLLRTTTDSLSHENNLSLTQLWAIYYQVEMIKPTPAPVTSTDKLDVGSKLGLFVDLVEAALFPAVTLLRILLYLQS